MNFENHPLCFEITHKSHYRNGCATSEDLFWKLDALQSFIRDLHWPDPEFRQHLEQRLKLMACDMIESCLQRTEQSFQSWLKKSVTFISTDYIISTEMCAMVNVILDAKNQSFKLCSVDGIDVVSNLWILLPGFCHHPEQIAKNLHFYLLLDLFNDFSLSVGKNS